MRRARCWLASVKRIIRCPCRGSARAWLKSFTRPGSGVRNYEWRLFRQAARLPMANASGGQAEDCSGQRLPNASQPWIRKTNHAIDAANGQRVSERRSQNRVMPLPVGEMAADLHVNAVVRQSRLTPCQLQRRNDPGNRGSRACGRVRRAESTPARATPGARQIQADVGITVGVRFDGHGSVSFLKRQPAESADGRCALTTCISRYVLSAQAELLNYRPRRTVLELVYKNSVRSLHSVVLRQSFVSTGAGPEMVVAEVVDVHRRRGDAGRDAVGQRARRRIDGRVGPGAAARRRWR